MCPFRPRLIVGLFLALCPLTSAAEQLVTFRKLNTRPGDTSRQSMDCNLELVMSICQGGQTVQEQRQAMQRHQARQVTIVQVGEQVPSEAEIHYDASTVSVKNADEPAETASQAVTGKSYRVTRQNDQLHVTYLDGNPAPEAECEIVRENMSSFGQLNPITEFFAGKKIRVGQTLQLPPDVAQDLLGFAQTPGSVSAFKLTLRQIVPAQSPHESPLARFDIQLLADDPNLAGIEMQLVGSLELEVNSCRARRVQLAGPVSSEETHGPAEGQFQVKSAGQIEVAVQAEYTRR